jgi:hypothetical protein
MERAVRSKAFLRQTVLGRYGNCCEIKAWHL